MISPSLFLPFTGGGKADLANGSLPVSSEGTTGPAAESPEAFLQQVLGWAQEYATNYQL